MAWAIFAVIAFFILRALIGSGGRFSALARLQSRGQRGRALVLAAARISVGVRNGAQRFEQRTMTLDIEVPGRGSFVVQGNFLIPRGVVEPIPGASLDVAVDGTSPNNVAILGPGGFTGPWIQTAVSRGGTPNAY